MKRLRELETENSKLKLMYAVLTLENAGILAGSLMVPLDVVRARYPLVQAPLQSVSSSVKESAL